MGKPSDAEFVDTFVAMQEEGQGVWRVQIFRPQDGVRLLAGVMTDDPVALRAIAAIRHIFATIRAGKPAAPEILCALCETPFHAKSQDPAAIALLTPDADDPSGCMAAVVCAACDSIHTRAQLREALMGFYRDNLIPGAEALPPLSPPGRA